MLFSIGLILLLGFIIGSIFEKIRIPRLVGMIIVGIIVGRYVLNLLDEKILAISNELRQIALVIILTRAGLSLNLSDFKKIGRPAILMCFLPATFEIIGTTLFAPKLLGINVFEALLLGSVLGAVSPAIIVPRMIKLKEESYGTKNKIPDLLLVGSSADDVYVIVLFYSFLGLVKNNVVNFNTIALIPSSIVLGVLLGIIVGLTLSKLFKKINIETSYQILILLCASFLMIVLENAVKTYVSISSLLGIISVGMVLHSRNKDQSINIERGYHKLWNFFEIFLFVLVGASVNINYAYNIGAKIILLIIIALVFRTVGVLICLIKTGLSCKEKIFLVISYLPKATVQASIGGIALEIGLPVGGLILTSAVAAIFITAPLGALLIDTLYKTLLDRKAILSEFA